MSEPGLHFEFEPISALPRMSWCARLGQSGTVVVRHGDWVETRPKGFVEGAWDGEFDAFEFDRAQTLAGSGAVMRDGACIFAAPFHPLERLYVLRRPQATLVSNSLVFVLQEAGDGLDLSHKDYFFDLLRMARRGIGHQPSRLRTARGQHVELYTACRLAIDCELNLQCNPMPLGPPPTNYEEYFEHIYNASRRIVENAADPARTTTYAPAAACSKGYDSTASAALASLVGCKEGLTFARSGRAKGHPVLGMTKELSNDSGAESLRALGMNVTERERLTALQTPGHPRAEFYFSLIAQTDASIQAMEDKLRGTVLFSGRHGERYWGPTSRCSRRNFREVDDCNLSGHASPEFRMRTGFIHLPAPYIAALHGPAIFRITHSEQMRPWKLGVGYYDRPIARRIAEEAGVPRENFGHVKFGGGDNTPLLSQESDSDLRDFIQSEVPERVRQSLDFRPLRERSESHFRVKYLRTHHSHWPLGDQVLSALQTDRLHRLWNSAYLYFFHWGFQKTRARYVVS